MGLQVGARVGPYEVVALLGAGGMGEVYRATDTKLKRDVALKLLPETFAADPDRVARFEREAHVLASLNHPQIAAVYGLEDGAAAAAGRASVQVLIMELVDGEDLSARIARGAIPLDEALPIAKQIAEGLEAAHDAGVVHRDLKPANIKLRPDGKVKILDFGLAKAVEAAASGSGAAAAHLSFSPTMTSPAQMTSFGVVLGTAAYMSPEQAKGRPVDKRADVWAFGAVLFEMLTGRPCFHGDDVSEMFAAILREAPDWRALPPNTPPAIRRLLHRCLERDVHSRLSDMAMVRVELRDAEKEPADEAPGRVAAAAAPPSAIRRLAPFVAAILSALAAAAIVWRLREPAEAPQPVARFSLDLPSQMQLMAFGRNPLAISPDGTRLVYAANQRLYIRALDQIEGTPIAGTEGGVLAASTRAPFFSPDGQWIGFWQQNQLRKVPISGGAAVTICESMVPPVGVRWEADGRVVFGVGAGGIQWVPANGGTAAPLVSVKDGERAASPQLLPGGEWVLFTFHPASATNPEQGLAIVQSLKTGERRTLVTGTREARYLPSNHLVFTRGNTLLAQPFDLKGLTLSGGPVPVLEAVSNAQNATPATFYAVSNTGTLFYAPGTSNAATVSRLVAVARDGSRTALGDVPGMSWFPRFSPDGSRIAYGVSTGTDTGDASDLWVLDVRRGARTRVTFSGNNRYYPIWTRDGTRLTHADSSALTNRVLLTAADGSGTAETLVEAGQRAFPTSWSPDGRVLAVYMSGGVSSRDVAMLSLGDEKRKPVPFVATPFEERGAIFSPDGRWIAYVSTKTGQNDVFARPYPGPGAEVTISAGGGQEPVWAPSGKELFYRHAGALYAVRVDATPSSLTVGAPARVFDDPFRPDTGGANGGVSNYDIAPDGKRFVMVEEPKPANGSPAARLTVVLNWLDELKRRAPLK